MNSAELAIGWFIVPGAWAALLGSLVAAFWNHRARKELSALESRLRQQEETYRLAQSPRVVAAIELWCALCDYERSLAALLNPIQRTYSATSEDFATASAERARRQRVAERETWAALNAARGKAEFLLPIEVLKAFDEFFVLYREVHELQDWIQMPGVTRESREGLVKAREERLTEAADARRAALGSLQGLLG